jgi:hypothetical protein
MYFVGLLIFAASVFFVPTVATAQTQPGSVGGTIGKHEKSISGEEEQPTTKNRTSRPRPRPASTVTAAPHGPGPAEAPQARPNCRLNQGSAQFGIEVCD